MPNLCAVYCRLSNQGETSESIARQAKLGSEYAKLHNLTPVLFVEPPGVHSGYYEKSRPEWARLKKEIEHNPTYAMVVVSELSRASRNTLHTLLFIDFLSKHSVKFVSLKEQIDPATAMGKFMLTLTAGIAQLERDNTSERKKNQYRARDKSIFASNTAPYGMERSGHYPNIIWSASADFPTILRLFELYLSGRGATAIAKKLHDEGYTWVNRRGVRHNSISHRTVSNCIDKAERYKPLLPPALYARIIAERTSRHAVRAPLRNYQNSPLLLRGVVYCARCGERYTCHLYHVTRRGKRYSYPAYTHRVPPHCDTHPYTIRARKLDAAVLERMSFLNALPPNQLDFLAGEIYARLELPNLPDTEAELKKLKNERERLARQWLAAGLTDDLHNKLAGELDAREAELLKQETYAAPTLDTVRSKLSDIVGLLSGSYAAKPHEANRAIRGLIQRVLVCDDHLENVEFALSF